MASLRGRQSSHVVEDAEPGMTSAICAGGGGSPRWRSWVPCALDELSPRPRAQAAPLLSGAHPSTGSQWKLRRSPAVVCTQWVGLSPSPRGAGAEAGRWWWLGSLGLSRRWPGPQRGWERGCDLGRQRRRGLCPRGAPPRRRRRRTSWQARQRVPRSPSPPWAQPLLAQGELSSKSPGVPSALATQWLHSLSA